MNDHELDRLLRKAQPESAVRVPAVAPMLREAGWGLVGDIMSVPDPGEIPAQEVVPMPVPRIPRRRWLLGLVAAVAVLLAVAVPVRVLGSSGTPAQTGSHTLPQTPLTGSGIPYFVLRDANWTVTVVKTMEAGSSIGLNETGTGRKLGITWYQPADESQLPSGQPKLLAPGPIKKVKVFGKDAELQHRPDGSYILAFLPFLGAEMEFSGVGFSGVNQFYDVVAELRQVSEKEWLAGLPKSVVTPDRASATRNDLLSDVSLPKALKIDAGRLPEAYQTFAQNVATGVGCSWIEEYNQAYLKGQAKIMDQAAQGLAGYPDWKAMQQVQDPSWALLFARAEKTMAAHRKLTNIKVIKGRCYGGEV